MKIGIAAATELEIQPVIGFLEQHHFCLGTHTFELCITGVGCMAATYHLMDFLQQHQPGYMLQAGLGGRLNNRFNLADVVVIGEEVLGDFGVEEDGKFRDIFDLGLLEPAGLPFHDRRLINPYVGHRSNVNLPLANGVTVNEITTRASKAAYLQSRYGSEIESMEGAALHYVCLKKNQPFMQLRAVSNDVGERNKSKWKIKEAIYNLNEVLLSIIKNNNIQPGV